MENPQAYRLPKHVRPTGYEIELDARVGKPDFDGRVRIRLRIGQPTDVVEIHAREIAFREASLQAAGGVHVARVEPLPEAEMARLRFEAPIPAGEGLLDVRFVGRVGRNMEGLYLSENGAERCLATQCEETDARAIFPCFDEPEFKATFAWRVTTDPENQVLANGPLVGVEPAEDKRSRVWTFGATRPMSSYLVALVVGPLAATDEVSVGGTPVRVWAMAGKERLGAMGRDVAARLLPWYEDYFDAPYPFVKYDQVAVPSFSAGAMENSGLVLFRESLLLFDPRTTSWRMEKRIVQVVSHEMAHMWFGNLVTMAWWDDIWLNESFAEWIAHRAIMAVDPRYRVWDDFQEGRLGALVPDALGSTHSIYNPVESAQQATELFDLITYQKGSTVLRMLEQFLGEEGFRSGMRAYVRAFAERNARGADLWRCLEEASHRPVTAIMESWITQPGFPLVSIAPVGEAGARLRLRQARYFADPRAGPTGQLWHVPLVVRYEDDAGVHEARHLLEGAEGVVELPAKGRVRWVVGNTESVGFYRVEPEGPLLEGLLANAGRLSGQEQTGLLDDQWALVRAGRQDVARFLAVHEAVVEAARENAPLERALVLLQALEVMLHDTADAESLARLRAHAARLFAPHLARVGLAAAPGEDPTTGQVRLAALEALAVLAREPGAVAAGLALAGAELRDPASVDANLAGLAVGVAVQAGGLPQLERHVREYEARRARQASPAELGRYLNSLAMADQAEAIARALRVIEDGVLPLESVGPLLRLMLGRAPTRVPAWTYLRDHWDDLRARLGDQWVGRLVDHTGNLPARMQAEMEAFLQPRVGGFAEQSFGRAMESVALRGELEARVVPALREALARRA